MTIAIGMRFDEGYLLAADTLVTVSGHYKMAQSKLRVLRTKSCRAFFAIAGDVEFSNRAIEIIQTYLNQAEPDMPSVVNFLEAAVFDVNDRFRDFGMVLQMLSVITVKDVPPKFVTINGPIVSPAGSINCIGNGEPLARFLINQVYPSQHQSKEMILRVAAYVLYNVKNHVDGCGGSSQFVAVSNDGGWHSPYTDQWTFEDLKELENTFGILDKHIGKLVPSFASYGKSKEFEAAIEEIKSQIIALRSRHIKQIGDNEEAYIQQQMEWYEQQALEDDREQEEYERMVGQQDEQASDAERHLPEEPHSKE
jgi:20S proteasome alpha/beta subunit